MGMYEVCAKCGHVGRNYYIEKTFAVRAESGKEAAAKVRQFPRVKHHHKDAIRFVREVDEFRFCEIVNINSADPFFKCSSIQEQREICTLEVLREDGDSAYKKKMREESRKAVYCGKQKIRNPKKYSNYNMMGDVA